MALLQAVTQYGAVLGQPSDNQRISIFKGIPFAKPPVGPLRWREPQKPDPWDQPYSACTFGPIPYQYRVPAGSVTQKEFYPVEWPRSEDCLYLNVWTPAAHPGENLPVAVWIYGGGFSRGYSNKQETNGESFARRGCVYVDFNYRLGVFGFMAHPELREESPHHSCGNYGLMDQIMALQWVKDNIAAFGGNPNQITVFGQSAGAMSTMNLMVSPLSQNNFQQAIMQSGGGLHPMQYPNQYDLDFVEARGRQFLDLCGVKNIAQARALPTEVLFNKSQEFAKSCPGMAFGPCVDGYALPCDPNELIRMGKCPSIRCMIGHNRDETSFDAAKPISSAETPADAEAWIRENRGKYAEKILAAENLQTCGDVRRYMTSAMQRLMMPGTYAFADVYAQKHLEQPLYLYIFDHTPPGDPDVGVYHSAEKMYIFETIIRNWRPMTPDDYKLSLDMADYWANFVKYGDPNGQEPGSWRPYDPSAPAYMSLDTISVMKPLEPDERTEAYRKILRQETAVL